DKVIYFIKNKSLEKFLIDDGKLYIENNEPSNSSNSFLYTFIFILIAAPLFYLFLTFISGDKKKEIDYCNSEERAYLASTNMVRNTLKSPSSAKKGVSNWLYLYQYRMIVPILLVLFFLY
ncbi:hypothetical protein, partial [Proteus mirabilis]|uniref:hypothetical protein n=1 Tax=Proteus mirabilis TaxID=584 RepID=UPI00142FAA06